MTVSSVLRHGKEDSVGKDVCPGSDVVTLDVGGSSVDVRIGLELVDDTTASAQESPYHPVAVLS